MASPRLRVRREVFELCLLPQLAALLPRLDGVGALSGFQRRLLAHSVPAGTPERRLVTASSLASSLGVSESAAAALLDVLASAAPAPPPLTQDATQCIHAVLLLLFVNCFVKPHAQSALRVEDSWPESGARSPTKAVRRSHAGGLEDEALQHAFVLRHVATLLPLLRSTPAAGSSGVDVHLSAAEFDRIGFLFAVLEHPPGTRLSEVAPAFAGGVQKAVSLATARDWLSTCCAAPLQPGAPPRSGDFQLEGAHRTTVLLREADVSGCVRLNDCSELTLYVLAPLGLVNLVNCSDCTFILGAVSRCLRMEGCVRCNVTVAARCVQLRGVSGGILHLAVGRPSLVLGDGSRGVRVAPYNTHYEALERHLVAAGLSVSQLASGAWERSQSLACGGGAVIALTPLPAAELLPQVIPFSALAGGVEARPTRSNPFPLPPPYAAELEVKTARVSAVQAAVQEAQLSEPLRNELQAAIQRTFREWLTVEGKMRGISELSRIV